MPTEKQFEIAASSAEAGQRLDVFLAPHFGSRSAAQKSIDAGLVTVDGESKNKRYLITGHETIVVDKSPEPDREIGQSTAQFIVAYEDEHLFVIDKPAGVVVHPARRGQTGTLVQALAGQIKGGDDPTRPGVVHRLDRDTSGLMVIARSEQAYTKLKQLIQRHEITREYIALVEGTPSAKQGTIDAPIGRDPKVRTRMSVHAAAGRDAVTHFWVQQIFSHTTLLRVQLQTGRTHQIRAHLKAIGHPVIGDPEYGTPELYGLTRQFLHAQRLAFTHPITGDQIDLSSPLSADLQAALDKATAE